LRTTCRAPIFLRVNPERLAELQRQRDLVRAHLAWLEREIEIEIDQGRPAAPATVPPSRPLADPPTPAPLTTGLSPAPDFAASLAAEIPAPEYEPDSRSIAQSTRRGCIIAAIGGFLLFVAVMAAVLFFAYGDRPLLLMERDSAPAERLPASTPAHPPQK
jgi:hypothetical protein